MAKKGYEAGTAFVQVVPSMKGFHQKVRKDLAKLGDEVEVEVKADTKTAEREVDKLKKSASELAKLKIEADTTKAQADIKSLIAKRYTTKVNAEADTARAQAKIAALAALKPQVDVNVDANVAKAKAALDKLEARKVVAEVDVHADVSEAEGKIRALMSQRETSLMRIDADTKLARAKLQELRQQNENAEINVDAEIALAETKIKGLVQQRHNVNVDVDAQIGRAEAQIAQAKAKWSTEEIQIDADISAARSKLTEVSNEVDALNGRRANVRMDVEGAERVVAWTGLITAGLATVGHLAPVAGAALGSLPAVIGLVGQSATALAVGFNGVGDAVKAVNTVTDEMGNATEAQIDNMNDALAQLTEEGRSFVHFYTGEFRGAMQGIGDSVQSSLLPHMEQSLRNLQTLTPLLNSSLSNTANVLGTLSEQGSMMISSGPWTQDFRTIAAANDRILWSMGQAGLNTADAFRSIWVASLPLVGGLAEVIENWSIMLNQFIQTKRESGELQMWFGQMRDRLFDLFGIVQQITQGLWRLMEALAPVGEALLQIVGNVVEAVGWFAKMNPEIVQMIAVAGIAASALLVLGRGIGSLTQLGASARAGFAQWSTSVERAGQRAMGAVAPVGALTTAVTRSGSAGRAASSAIGTVVTAGTRLVSALPGAALAVTAVAIAHDALTTSAKEGADALLKGGLAAQEATAKLQAQQGLRDAITGVGQALGITSDDISVFGKALFNWAIPGMDGAKAAADRQFASMNNVEQAQSRATQAQNNYDLAVRRFGENSPQAIIAQDTLRMATDRLEGAQSRAANATKSHRDRLIELHQQQISMLEGDLAYRMSLSQLEQSQRAVADAVAQHGAQSWQARDANLQLEQAFIRTSEAAGKKAGAEYHGTDATHRAKLETQAYDREMMRLVSSAGDHAPEALRRYIGGLDRSTLEAHGARIETDAFGNSVIALPDGGHVPISAPGAVRSTEEVQALHHEINSLPAQKSIRIHIERILAQDELAQSNPNSGIPLPLGNAAGNIVQFARGGFAGLTPMDTIAQVVQPNTWRVVGDNMRVDEAYIPIENTPRSTAILTETAKRMGFDVVPTGIQKFAKGAVATQGASPATPGLAADPATIEAMTAAVKALHAALLEMNPTLFAVNGSLLTLNDSGLLWAGTMNNIVSPAVRLLQFSNQNLTAFGLVPLKNEIHAGTVPALQLLQFHAGVLSVQSVTRLANLLPPLSNSFIVTGAAIRNSWTQNSNHIAGRVFEIRGHFDSLMAGMREVDRAIYLASLGIRDNWFKIQGYAHAPMKWVVDVVWNTGLLPIWNGVSEIFGQPRLNPVQFRHAGGAINGIGGGRVPGKGDKDTVPAMLTPGEYVLSKPAIANMGGLGAIDKAHKRAREGAPQYANTGGLIQKFAGGGAVAGGHTWPLMWDAIQKGVPGVRKTSDFRPGDSGYHGRGQALDVAMGSWSQHAALADWIGRSFPHATQVISAQWRGGTGILNGRPHYYAADNPDHYDHVHWAMSPAAMGGQVPAMFGGGSFMDPRAQKAIDDMKRLKDRIDPGVNGFFGGRGDLKWPTLQRNHSHKVVDGLIKKLNEVGMISFGAGGGGYASANPNVIEAVRETAGQFGWSHGPQWDALARLIEKESSWNPGAANPTSSARGLFQKMTSIHGPVEPTPGGQALWGLNYIRGRYGDPISALAFHNANNWYNQGGAVKPTLYDSGGVLEPGPTLTYNGTRKPEAVLTNRELVWLKSAAQNSGNSYYPTINVETRTDASPEATANAINRNLQHSFRTR